ALSRRTPTRDIWRGAGGVVTPGTRNILAIAMTFQCVAGVVEHPMRRVRAELLPRYPNVNDVVAWSTYTAAARPSSRPKRSSENVTGMQPRQSFGACANASAPIPGI